MPNAALHFVLARRVLSVWEARPIAAPFELSERSRNAFFHGAIGPDMGYFPGAAPILSQLAHHARTGELCRALVEEARGPVQAAFAWGWVTHVLADVAVHPLVNRACGERLTGTRTPVWGDEVGTLHMRVEIGLDAVYRARHPDAAAVRLAPALSAEDARFVVRAYRRTFGAAPEPAGVMDAHRRVTRLSALLALVLRLSAAALCGRGRLPRLAARLPLGALAALCPRGSHGRALFTPLAPAPWLVAEVDEVVDEFPDWFLAHFGSGLQFLRDHCLDTGEAATQTTPRAHAAIAAIRAAAAGRTFHPRPALA